MITDYIGGEGSAETPKNDYVIYGWPLKWNGVEILLNFIEAISSILRILKIRILACSQFKSKRGNKYWNAYLTIMSIKFQ